MTRTIRLLGIVVLTALAAATAAGAAQELTLRLETQDSVRSQPKDPSADARAIESVAAKPEPKKEASRQNQVVVGRVGIVQSKRAYIYASKSSRSRRYSTVKAETPLAIVREEGDWYGILMTNRGVGWISRKHVRITDYNLVAKKPASRGEPATSRGGTTSRDITAGSEIIRTALRYNGVPYVYGGTSPTHGMDCSAFVRSVFAQFGISLPRTAREQALVGTSVPFDQLKPGDRLYFACYNSHVDHCGIYAGNGYFVHCSRSRNGLGVDSLASDFFWRSLVAARRS